jgi:DNA-binding SARP family transcriptional activator
MGAELVMIRVLGPVDLFTTEGVVAVGGPLERKLLAALAVSANHLVTTDQMSQILWPGEPPRTAAATLQTHLSRLRQHLKGGRITGEDHGYRLDITRAELDALVFEDLVSRATCSGQAEESLSLCAAALGLWRGVPFGDLADEEPFRLEAIRLDELRLLVMEVRLRAEIGLGRYEIIVGELEALAEEYPYRESFWYLLITALSMAGRRVEALRSYDRLRGILADVGLEPTEDLRRLEERILLEDPAVRPRLGPA